MSSEFVKQFNKKADEINAWARGKGFWSNPDRDAVAAAAVLLERESPSTSKTLREVAERMNRNDSEMLMLAVTELGEAVEGLRHRNPPSEHIPEFSAAEEEVADTIIRLMDQSHARGWRVAEAIEAKMEFNNGRPPKHGKEF